MSLAIQKFSDFNANNISFSKLRKNKNGGKAVYLNSSDNKKIFVQLPFMRSPYGLSVYTDEGTGRTSYSLDLSFDPCLLYTSPSPRDLSTSRMPSSA